MKAQRHSAFPRSPRPGVFQLDGKHWQQSSFHRPELSGAHARFRPRRDRTPCVCGPGQEESGVGGGSAGERRQGTAASGVWQLSFPALSPSKFASACGPGTAEPPHPWWEKQDSPRRVRQGLGDLVLRSGLPHVPLWGQGMLSGPGCSCFFKVISWAARHTCPPGEAEGHASNPGSG